MSIREEVVSQAKRARVAARKLANVSTEVKDKALLEIANRLEKSKDIIIAENSKDMEAGEKAGLTRAMLDRLELNEKRIKGMADGLRELVNLKDPIGDVIKMWKRPNGLQIGQMRVPLGVIGIIYESRPNVTIDAAGLCLKAGNSTILKGGSESINTNLALSYCIREACAENNLNTDLVQIMPW
ncbi:MAG: aldehyde dehydrogenase family protein, partial [Halanaerobiales bacterium]